MGREGISPLLPLSHQLLIPWPYALARPYAVAVWLELDRLNSLFKDEGKTNKVRVLRISLYIMYE